MKLISHHNAALIQICNLLQADIRIPHKKEVQSTEYSKKYKFFHFTSLTSTILAP